MVFGVIWTANDRKERKKEMALLQVVKQYIENNKLLKAGDLVIVGLSSGADSICLLELLYRLQGKLEIRLLAAHLHHGIRKETADRDYLFAEKFCEQRGITFRGKKVDVPRKARQSGHSLEEAGREERYLFFEELAGQYRKEAGVCLALAHHMNDQAETVLFRLARGTGLKGLCGMQPSMKRQYGREVLKVVRPLLGVSKQELLDFLAEQGIGYCEDETNQEMDYTRNRIRQEILPALGDGVNSAVVRHIAQTAGQAALAESFIQEQVKQSYDRTVKNTGQGLAIDLVQFGKEHLLLQQEVLRTALMVQSGSARDISREHIEALLRLAAGSGSGSISLPYGCEARRTYGWIYLIEEGRDISGQQEMFLVEPSFIKEIPVLSEECPEWSWEQGALKIQVRLHISSDSVWIREKKEEILKNDYTKCYDYDRMEGRLFFRTRKPGDVLQVGTQGQHKKLKEYLIETKVPAAQREKRLLLAQGSRILWVVGLRTSEEARVTEQTSRLLEVSVVWREDDKGRNEDFDTGREIDGAHFSDGGADQ